MESASEILDKITAALEHCRTDAYDMLHDRRITQWDSVNFDAVDFALFASLDIPKTIKKSRDEYNILAKQISQAIEEVNNRAADLQTDLNHKSISAEKAASKALELERYCQALNAPKQTFMAVGNALLEADTKLKNTLNIQSLLRFAKETTRGQDKKFEEGYQAYTELIGSGEKKDDLINKMFDRAMVLENALNNIQRPDLPGLAMEVVNHHNQTALASLGNIKIFLDKAEEGIETKVKELNNISKHLELLKREPINKIIKGIEANAKIIGKIFVDLRYQSHLPEELRQVSSLLDVIGTYQSVMQRNLLEKLDQEINTPGSSLNLQKTTMEKADKFFSGFSGLIRTLRLLISSFSGGTAFSETELIEKLEDALQQCTFFYGTDKKAIVKLKKFIDGYISSYDKPFPYDFLFSLFKNAIVDYGEGIEKFINTYKCNMVSSAANHDGSGTLPAQPPPGNATVGTLIAQIKKQTENMGKIS